MNFKFNHNNLNVRDLEKSIQFYKDALGLTVVREKDEPYVNGGRDTHLAFEVDDMDAARALHEEMGCVCFVNERMGIYFIEDPDGYWLEIVPEK